MIRARDGPVSLDEKAFDYGNLVPEASSLEEAASVVTEALIRKVFKALSIPTEDLDPSELLHNYGVDSLVAVELRNCFAKEFSADVAVFEIGGSASFNELSTAVAKKSQLRQT